MASVFDNGAVAQLGERLLCKQEVVGSIPSGSTINRHRALIVLFRKVFKILLLVVFMWKLNYQQGVSLAGYFLTL